MDETAPRTQGYKEFLEQLRQRIQSAQVFQLERHAVRGRAAIKLRVLLAGISLNVRNLVSLRRKVASSELSQAA